LRHKSSKIRLSGKKAFSHVFAGRRVVTPDLVFHYAPNRMDFGRMGLVIGKKAYVGAVTRNRLKRLLRAHFRRIVDAVKGFDVAIVARQGRKLPDFKTLERQMDCLADALGKSRL